MLYCPKCRQTIGRTALDPYPAERLLIDRGFELVGGEIVEETWTRAGRDELS